MSKTNIRPMIEVALFATIAYILGPSYPAHVTRPFGFPFPLRWYLSFSSVFAGA